MSLRQLVRFLLTTAMLGGTLIVGSVAPVPIFARTALAVPLPPCPPRPKTKGLPWPPFPCYEKPAPPLPPADICLRLAADPSGAIAPAGIVTYRLAAHNSGRGPASIVQVALPFAPDAQSMLDAAFTNPIAWVSAVRASEVEMRLGPLGSDETITGTLRLHIDPSAVPGRALITRARLEWTDEQGAGAGLSNRVSLVVGGASANSPTVPLEITPAAGSPATTFAAAYGGFASYERVSLWYHRPDGRVVALNQVQADAQGQIGVSLAATTLSAGRYMLVAYGVCSQVSAVGVFIIE